MSVSGDLIKRGHYNVNVPGMYPSGGRHRLTERERRNTSGLYPLAGRSRCSWDVCTRWETQVVWWTWYMHLGCSPHDGRRVCCWDDLHGVEDVGCPQGCNVGIRVVLHEMMRWSGYDKMTVGDAGYCFNNVKWGPRMYLFDGLLVEMMMKS